MLKYYESSASTAGLVVLGNAFVAHACSYVSAAKEKSREKC